MADVLAVVFIGSFLRGLVWLLTLRNLLGLLLLPVLTLTTLLPTLRVLVVAYGVVLVVVLDRGLMGVDVLLVVAGLDVIVFWLYFVHDVVH